MRDFEAITIALDKLSHVRPTLVILAVGDPKIGDYDGHEGRRRSMKLRLIVYLYKGAPMSDKHCHHRRV